MKQICLTFLVFVAITYVAASQTANLVLNTPESGNQLHQATNSITFAIGYS